MSTPPEEIVKMDALIAALKLALQEIDSAWKEMKAQQGTLPPIPLPVPVSDLHDYVVGVRPTINLYGGGTAGPNALTVLQKIGYLSALIGYTDPHFPDWVRTVKPAEGWVKRNEITPAGHS